VKLINVLNDILGELFCNREAEIAGERASLEYFTDQVSFDFKDRTGMANNYYVDSACYFLTRTPSNNLSGLSDIQEIPTYCLSIPNHMRIYIKFAIHC
jgi:hypothetical protein